MQGATEFLHGDLKRAPFASLLVAVDAVLGSVCPKFHAKEERDQQT
jgi:hypothetical protein